MTTSMRIDHEEPEMWPMYRCRECALESKYTRAVDQQNHFWRNNVVASDRKIYMHIYIYVHIYLFYKTIDLFYKTRIVNACTRVETLKGSRNRISFSSFLRRRREKKESRILSDMKVRERERRKTRGKSRTLRTIYVDLITLPVHLSSSAKKKKRKKNK